MTIIPQHDHYTRQIDPVAMAVWILFAIMVVWHGVTEYRLFKADKRMTHIEDFQGPATPTEWRVVNGKVVLHQSPYIIQVAP